MAAAPSGLPTSRLASRSAARSAAPDGETPRCAWPARPRSCTSACAPVRSTTSTSAPVGDEADDGAGLQQGRRGRGPGPTATGWCARSAASRRARGGGRCPTTRRPARPPRPGPRSAAVLGGAPAGGRSRRAGSRSRARSRRSRPSTPGRCAPRSPRRGQPDQLGHLGQVRAVVVGHRSPPRVALRRGLIGAGSSSSPRVAAAGSAAPAAEQEDRPRSGHHLGDLVEIEPLQGRSTPTSRSGPRTRAAAPVPRTGSSRRSSAAPTNGTELDPGARQRGADRRPPW